MIDVGFRTAHNGTGDGIGGATRRTVFAIAAMGSVVALVGLAGVAGASATVDLIWIDVSETNSEGDPICLLPANRNCAPDPRSGSGGVWISSVAVSDTVTLGVILTAGPNGSIGGGVSVNYGGALPALGVRDFQSLETTLPLPYLTFQLGATTNQSPYIDNINAAAGPALGYGIGLPAGQSAYLGTVTFHSAFAGHGVRAISVGTDGPGQTDAVLDGVGNTISGTTTFNSAFLVGEGDPPSCSDSQGNAMQIEVNALRAIGKTVRAGANQRVDVTAKARILKGTAVSDTTIDTKLTIKAVDATGVIDTETSNTITLGVGKGGAGDKLTLDTTRCDGGYIEFRATFSGTDDDGDLCKGTESIYKQCS